MRRESFVARNATKVLAGAVVMLSVLNAFSAYNLARPHHKAAIVKVHSFEGDDYPSQLPIHAGNDDVVLEFGNKGYNITSDEDWGSLIPENGGIIHLGPSRREFQVSMYRQLQCLDTIRIAYLDLHARPSPLRPANFTEAELCIDMLRQSILCNADITLDPAWVVRLDDGRLSAASSGAEVDHRCQDWTRVREVVEKDEVHLF